MDNPSGKGPLSGKNPFGRSYSILDLGEKYPFIKERYAIISPTGSPAGWSFRTKEEAQKKVEELNET